MTSQIEIGIEGRLGVIALNRPEAINALNHEMIEAITAQLLEWSADPAIQAVLFEGRGTRGFCSGGDVRAARAMVVDGRPEDADAYFAAEYRMNTLIATYAKPVVVIADGIVMGGGIGIAGHARFRFTTQDAKFAMPEAGIGLVSDIGVNWILAKAPENRALLFLMTGLPVTGADVLALGLADCCVERSRLDEVRSAIVRAARDGAVERELTALMQSESIQAGARQLCDLADRFEVLLELPTAAEIVAGLDAAVGEAPELELFVGQLKRLSPTSLEAIVISHRAARALLDVEAVLALDLRLASFMARHPDFAEGVRAQLVDKDRAPRWRPEDLAGVDRAALESAANGGTSAQPA